MTETKLNLYQKIAQIIEAIGTIQKDAEAPAAMGGYKFISHGIVLANLRHEFVKRNVVIRPSGEELLRADVQEKRTPTYQNGQVVSEKVSYNHHSIIKYRFTVVDGDNPSDFFEDFWIGEGMDNGDKGIQKAGTSAEKYYLMKLFKIGDKDDPDGIDTDGTTKTESQSATITKPPVSRPPTPFVPPNSASVTTATVPPEPKNELERLVQEAGLNGAPVDVNQKEVSPETYKNQIDALIWLGEQLPSSMGWFRGKIVPMVSLWETRSKSGKLTKETGLDSASGIDWLFGQIKAAHVANCGSDKCEHLTVAKVAVLMGGRITDPAK